MTSIADIQRVFVVALAGLPVLPGFSIELPYLSLHETFQFT